LGEVVDGHYASYAVGHRKPEAAYYAEVTRRLGIAPQHIIFWDDNEANVEAARASGWLAHLYTGVQDFQQVMELD